ncbi:hypothetical protein [Cloacibacillus evryensis]|uniref:hypothetical protein n=1 Tax=Cloacibacillus evryensis TaxID=508460 RepID=UPI0024203C8D|nr:hypothetical protein [Cloacibacillus evryensis]
MQVERLRRVAAREPLERIRRSTDAPQGAFGVVDKSGLILADAAGDAAARFELVAKRRQDDWDKAKVNEALNSLYSEDQKLRFDPEKGLLVSVNGAGAKGLYEKSDEVYGKMTQGISGKLENERQRRMFDEASSAFVRSARTSISRHEATEVRKYTLEQNEIAERNAGAAYAHGFKTPDGAAAALAAAQQSAVTEYGEAAVGFRVSDYSGKYNTNLSEGEEKAFQEWLSAESKKQGRDVSKDLFDYDLRGLFKEDGGFGDNGHAPDKFKKPNHPTFSTGSVYSGEDHQGGEWLETDGKWKFKPSDTNIEMQSSRGLKDYFSRAEPDAELEMTEAQAGAREPLNGYIKEKLAKITTLALDVLVRENPLEAEALLKNSKDKGIFDGVTYERIKAEVDKAALEVHLQEDTPKLFTEYGFDGLEEARKYIREHYEGAEESKRLTAAESLWREKWNDRKFKEEQASDQIFGMMDGGASLKQVNDAISAINWSSNGARIQMMRARDAHFKIGEYAPKATAVKTSRETLLALDELRNSGKLFEIAPTKTDFTNMFGGSLSDRDWRAYLKYYDDANKPGGRQKAAIKMNCDSTFSKKLKEAGVEDVQQQAFYQDRFNYEYEVAIKKKNGVIPTNEEAVAMMDVILAPEVVGKTKSFWGRTVDKVVRRGDIPPKEMINPDTRLPYGTEKDKDGRYFIFDKDGKKRPLIFPDGGGKPVPAPYTLD